jgi:geranylgeranyl reductase family protein
LNTWLFYDTVKLPLIQSNFFLKQIMNQNTFDVIIIGAGPAGCSAGIMLAKRGTKVLLIDKSEFPREKPCGGLLTEKTHSIISNTLGLYGLDEVILQKSNGFEVYSGKRYINSARTDSYTYYVSRKSFDSFLLEGAKHAGCTVLTNTAISSIEPNKIYIDSEGYDYKYLIGADGLNSMVRRNYGMPMTKSNIATVVKIEIPLDKMPIDSKWDLPKIFFGYVKYGWGWAFPKGGHVSLGLAALLPKGTGIKDVFNLFLSDLSCEKAAKDSRIRGGQIPYGSYLTSPSRDNVFLVGDAAGFVDPVTGEGIYYAISSGVIIADVLSNDIHKDKTSAYNNRCRKEIIKPIRQGLIARWFLFEEPFHSLAMKKFHGNAEHMKLFTRVLAGDVDYFDYFWETVKIKFRARMPFLIP